MAFVRLTPTHPTSRVPTVPAPFPPFKSGQRTNCLNGQPQTNFRFIGENLVDRKLSFYEYMAKSEGVGVATLNQVLDLIVENDGTLDILDATLDISACAEVSLLMTSAECPSQPWLQAEVVLARSIGSFSSKLPTKNLASSDLALQGRDVKVNGVSFTTLLYCFGSRSVRPNGMSMQSNMWTTTPTPHTSDGGPALDS